MSGTQHQRGVIAPHFRIGADERHAFMEYLRDHHAVERIGMIRKIRQRGDALNMIAADRQLGKTCEPERRTCIARMDGQIAFAIFGRDFPDGRGADVQRVLGGSINATAVAESCGAPSAAHSAMYVSSSSFMVRVPVPSWHQSRKRSIRRRH